MRNMIAALTTILLLAVSAVAPAYDHGMVSSIPHDHTSDQVFRVNIEKIAGEEPSPGANHYAHVGKNTITVSLVFNSSWGKNMADTQKYIYMKDIEIEVEKGKHYFIGAKVDTSASEAAQADGSFWNPVIAEVH